MIDYYSQFQAGNPNSTEDTYNQVVDLYSGLLGRTPDQEGLNYWMNEAEGLINQGGDAGLRKAFIAGMEPYAEDQSYYRVQSAAPYANTLTRESATHWDDYLQRAAAQQASMNSGPGVYNVPQNSGSLFNTAEQQATALNNFKDYWATVGNLTDDEEEETPVVEEEYQG